MIEEDITDLDWKITMLQEFLGIYIHHDEEIIYPLDINDPNKVDYSHKVKTLGELIQYRKMQKEKNETDKV